MVMEDWLAMVIFLHEMCAGVPHCTSHKETVEEIITSKHRLDYYSNELVDLMTRFLINYETSLE